MILAWQTYLYLAGSLALGLVATLKIVPEVLEHYGHTYFEWPADRKIANRVKFTTTLTVSACIAMLIFRSNPHFLPGLTLIITALLGIFVVDREFQLIPDRFHFIAIGGILWIWTALSLQGQDLRIIDKMIYGPGLASALLITTKLYEKFRKMSAMGMGDIKMFAWLGLLLGPDVVAVVFFSMIAALVWNVPKIYLKKISKHDPFAFGPFIVASAFLFMLI